MLLKLRRKFSALLVAFSFFLCFVPGVAVADTLDQRVIYTNDTSTVYQTIVTADNIYNAAALACGYTPQLLTDAVRSAASDPNYGGDFYSYAQTFLENMSVTDVPSFLPGYMYPRWVDAVGTRLPYGGYVYVSDTTNVAHTLAKYKLEEIIETGGEVSGGGGTIDPDTHDVTIYFSEKWSNGNDNSMYTEFNGVRYTLFRNSRNTPYPSGNKLELHLPQSIDLSVFSDIVVEMQPNRGTRFYFYIYLFRPGTWSYTTNDLNQYVISWDAGELFYTSDMYFTPAVNSGIPFEFEGSITPTIRNSPGGSHTCNNAILISLNDNSLHTNTPSAPDGDWPADPETPSPTPPELPEIDDNPVPTEPNETDININLPDVNITGGQSAADLTDLIAILKVINGNLVTINDNLEDEFNSVINAFNAIGGQIEQLAQRIREHCQHIRTSIYQNTTHLENEIYKLFHWLKDELDFGFDDSSIVDYLKRILDKLNNVSYQPNPIADPFSFFDWLMGLLGGFLASLVSGLPGVLQDLLTDLSSLTEYFPFSMPWDVYGLLLLFAHDPVTPVFDLPWNFAANHTAQIHIDLSQYDGIMAIVRAVEKVIFAAGLAVFTMRMFKPTDVLGDD